MRNALGKLRPGPYTAKRIGIGAGGWCKSVAAADDGTLILGNDTGPGPKILKVGATKWIDGMRAGETFDKELAQWPYPQETGATGTAISATDSNYMACMCMGYVWTSTDGGDSWTRRNLTFNWQGNARDTNGIQPKLLIDPNNKNVIYCCTDTQGLHRSLDFGATWTRIVSVPATVADGTGGMVVAVWRQGALVSGRSGTVAVVSKGNGTYISTDGGTTFTLSSDGPTTALGAIFTVSGKLLVTPGYGLAIRRFDGTTWTTTAQVGSYLASHPTLETVWCHQDNRGLTASTDGGATWSGFSNLFKREFTSIPWHSWTNEQGQTGGYLCWSPRFNGLSMVSGIGHWYIPNPATSFTGVSQSVSIFEYAAGIENMVVSHLDIVRTDGDVLLGMHDRTGMQFRRSTIEQYASQHMGMIGASITHGSNQDYAIDDPNWRAIMAGTLFQFTTDRWATRTTVSPTNGAFTGSLVVRDKGEVWVVSPTNRRPIFTLNSGATWNQCDFGAAANALMGNIANYNDYTTNRRVLRVDKITGSVYFYCVGGPAGTPEYTNCAGIWRLQRGETQFTRISTTIISEAGLTQFGLPLGTNTAFGADYYNGHLSITPDRSGHLWWAPGGMDGGGVTHAFFSKNHGATWEIVGARSSNLNTNPLLYPQAIGFGKPAPGSSYPTIYIVNNFQKVRERAIAEGHPSVARPMLYMIQDFNPDNPSAVTPEPVLFEYGAFYPGGDWENSPMVDGWLDDNNMALINTKSGGFFLEYSDSALAT